ncbi:hypothetical protein MesoLj131a_41640 [Mesorhizobium sp. 131-2-1]|nr:hypothetical protein MesoLj131a_41640 [Mesorhizobium sp. 131-2-1]
MRASAAPTSDRAGTVLPMISTAAMPMASRAAIERIFFMDFIGIFSLLKLSIKVWLEDAASRAEPVSAAMCATTNRKRAAVVT